MKAQEGAQKRLPPGFEASQVEALYSDARSFVIGAAAACVCVLIVGVRAKSAAIDAVAALIVGLAVGRVILLRRYRRTRDLATDRAQLGGWSRWYHAGAAAHIFLLGVFAVLTFIQSGDTVDRLLAFGTVTGYMAGVPGRNFASASGVGAQILAGAIPLLAMLAVMPGDYWLIAAMLLPFFVGLRAMAGRLRGIFVDATVKAHEVSLLANRFDTALNNMPHGLAMFGQNGTVLVHNGRLCQLLRLDPARDLRGAPMSALLAGVDQGGAGGRRIVARFEAELREPSAHPLALDFGEEVALEFSFQRMPNGGAVVVVQDVSERKRAEARINQLALFDQLTKLPNRTLFRTVIEKVLSPKDQDIQPHAVLFLDLDHFKHVNDTYGHTYGDLLIRQVADRLRGVIAEGDIVARFGGDEFVLLHRLKGEDEEAVHLAATLNRLITGPYHVAGHVVTVGVSIGVALLPRHGVDADDLVKKADLALYQAKGEGRGTTRFFEPSLDTQARARGQLEADLRQALPNGELEVFFQPIFDIGTGRFEVCEALLRWRHPLRGLVSPAEFIPIAEEMGLIVEMGDWVLRRACLDAARWPRNVRVAVNISPLQFRSGQVVASVQRALAESGLKAARLELELTESVLLQDIAFTKRTMGEIVAMRVGISLDDFGTGYSSLSYLHMLPLSKVKIDRSFLAGLGTDRKTLLMLRGVTRLSAELGLRVVVEGVETREQLDALTGEANVDEVQGFLFSRPVPARDLPALLGRPVGMPGS